MEDRATQVAARLRRLEQIRGKRAPIYAADPRLLPWVGLPEPDIREAYELAVTELEEQRNRAPLTVGCLVPYLRKVTSGPSTAGPIAADLLATPERPSGPGS